MDPIFQYILTAAAVLGGGLSIWNFIQSPSKNNEQLIEKLGAKIDLLRKDISSEQTKIDDKVDALSTRVSTLETIIHQMPALADMHRLELALEKVSGRLDTLSERLNPIDHLSRRLQEMLVENAK